MQLFCQSTDIALQASFSLVGELTVEAKIDELSVPLTI